MDLSKDDSTDQDEQSQETLALMQIIAIGDGQVKRGEVFPIEVVFKRVRSRISEFSDRSC